MSEPGSKNLSASMEIPYFPKREQGLTYEAYIEERPLPAQFHVDQQLTVANGTTEVILDECKVAEKGPAWRLEVYNIQLDKPTTGFDARGPAGGTITIRIYSKIPGDIYPGEPLDEEAFTQGALAVNVFFRSIVCTRDTKITAQLSGAPSDTIDLPIRYKLTKLA